MIARYHDPVSRDGDWLAIARALADALGRPDAVDPTLRPEARGRSLPPATVFLLGAFGGSVPGCLGHVAAWPASWSIGAAGGGGSTAGISRGFAVADAVIRAVVASVRMLAPDAMPPEYELVVPIEGEGDSHALAVGIASMHALIRAPVPPGLAATGGFDATGGRFRTVPVETIASKLAAARRWGIRRILVVEGQRFPEEASVGDLDVIEVSSDPGELPLVVLSLAGQGGSDEVDASALDAWRRALALYDIRVGRRPAASVEGVARTTAAFLDPVVEQLEAASHSDAMAESPPADEVRRAVDRLGLDPILVGLAADIRSRVHLHAGRTVEARWWDAIAVALRGLGDLPDGLLGDHLLHQQPSHRSVLAMDLGDLDDPDPRDVDHPHAALDASIVDLETRWCTRHQALLAIFASNTRWRRRLYLARRDLDRSRFEAASEDLLRWRPRWHELLETHARVTLGMGDTDLSRQWNYVLEHAVTDVSLAAPDAFAAHATPIDSRRNAAERWLDDEAFQADLHEREAAAATRSAYDLRGLLQWYWLRGDTVVPTHVHDACRARLENPADLTSPGVAEWWRRLLPIGHPDRSFVHAAIRRFLVPHLRTRADESPLPSSHAANPPRRGPVGIPRIVSLRRAALLDLDGVPVDTDVAETWVHSVERPDGPASLQRLFDDLVARPGLISVRTPY